MIKPLGIQTAIRLIAIGAYVLAIFWIMLKAGEPTAIWWWFIAIPFCAWIVAPIAVTYRIARESWLITVGITALAAYSAYIYVTDMFGPGARSTSALIFIFLPIYQWVAVGILLGANWLSIRYFRRNVSSEK